MSRRRTADQSRGGPTPAPVRPAPAPPPHHAAPRAAGRAPRQPAAPQDAVYRALLPLRFFLGGMFLYAGIDKLVDPGFLKATGPGSIGEQLTAFTHVSPLTPLIDIFAKPFPVAVGLAFAVIEIAIGLGALTGIFYRWSAAIGAALSALFFLTASWDTRPIYYGPDLPYMVGWITLALAGAGGVYVLEPRLLAWFREGPLRLDVDEAPPSAGRRAVLEAGVLGVSAVAIAVVGRAFGHVLSPIFTSEVGAAPTPAPTLASSAAPAASTVAAGAPSSAPVATAAATAAANEIANAKQMTPRSAADFQLANGDPGIVVKLADSKVVAYDATCTHEGCPVGYDPQAGLLMCPCHGAVFDPAQDGAVLQGPARRPLFPVPIKVDTATGSITVTG